MIHAREIQLLHSRQAVGLNWNSSEHCLNRTSNQKVRIKSLCPPNRWLQQEWSLAVLSLWFVYWVCMTRFQSQKSYKGKGSSDNMRWTDHSVSTSATVRGGRREFKTEVVPRKKGGVRERVFRFGIISYYPNLICLTTIKLLSSLFCLWQ